MQWIERRHSDTESEWSRDKYEGYMRDVPCAACGGARLKPEMLAVTLAGQSIAEVCDLSVGECAELLAGIELTDRQKMIAERVLKEINARLRFLVDVGLDYLSLDRAGRHPVRRRGAAHPAGHPDRLRPGRRALRAGRAVDRAAPARQPPADRDPGPAARPGQHADRGRARRGHHPHRRLDRRHRPRRGRARRQDRAQRLGAGAAGQPGVDHRGVPVGPRGRSRRRASAARRRRAGSWWCTARGSTTCAT